MNKMNPILKTITHVTAITLALLSTATMAKTSVSPQTVEGDIVRIGLSEFSPTQGSIGYEQVFYKLGRFVVDKKKMFDEICETNGQKKSSSFNAKSDVNDPQSFKCKEMVGTIKKDMKTIVLAPNGKYYLTDGHHTFNVFWAMPEGGNDFKVNVVVANDYRHLDSMDSFWDEMTADGNTWLSDKNGKSMSHHDLPSSLGMENFENDQYRSLMYFSRGVGWDKPKSPIPFLEFYWTKALRKQLDIEKFDLNSQSGYKEAIIKVSHTILALETDNLGLSGKSAKEMGQFNKFNQKGLDKLLRKEKGKVTYMMNYKKTL